MGELVIELMWKITLSLLISLSILLNSEYVIGNPDNFFIRYSFTQ